MTSSLDMALDDLIQKNKPQPSRGSKNRSGSGGPRNGPRRGGPLRRNGRPAQRPVPYSFPQAAERAPDGHWEHDRFDEVAGPAPLGPNTGIETGTKLRISNLDFAVSNEDIKELFSEVGDLKRNVIHYDRSGRSKGTAEVVYSRRADALTAFKRYNNVQLDGKPMKIEIVGTNLPAPNRAVKPMPSNPSGRRELSTRGGGFGGPSRRGRGKGRGGNKTEKSAEDLDAELDSYHAEAMQVS